MRAAGRVVVAVLDRLRDAAEPGVTTADLDALAARLTRDAGAIASFKGYHGFPASICASVNDAVVHGIPRADRPLMLGDVLKIDYGAVLDGWHADSAATVVVGGVAPDEATARLLQGTAAALGAAIEAVRPGARLGDLGAIISHTAAEYGLSVIPELTGHGIGREMHEPGLTINNYGAAGTGLILRPGHTFTIEPILALGRGEIDHLPDGWTVVTRDHSLAAHLEHTVAVTVEGVEVLT